MHRPTAMHLNLRDRATAAAGANAEDAEVWRWFSLLMQDRRVRWCQADDRWFVSVDNRHVATEPSFDEAIRRAKERVEQQGALKRRLR
ncbi:hypothetical protein [Caballeronia sp. LZ034LL]|uniref:hypothetical protein n=1 Tax=Caballeronia sp. LZ034LL TaxID=3038567 RepID=UPI002859ED1D|nr:hypothetical protein [Caballeronia sp. LZ034LL]MDR5835397.1 hypothetical protein [Caballeronia sp. LZ034LL]